MSAKKQTGETARARQSSPPIVINTTQGPRFIPYGGVSDGEGGVVDLERMKFASGFNAPKDPESFAVVSALPSYQGWIRSGVLQEIESVDDVPTIGDADDKIIEASSSRPSIEWWLAKETRQRVKAKLRKKIAEMKRHRAPGDED